MSNASESPLTGIAERMKRDALARPGMPVKKHFTNDAIVQLIFVANYFQSRIARKGLCPHHDYSAKGAQRRAAWLRELETFARAFDVPRDIAFEQSTYGTFYYATARFVLDVAQLAQKDMV